MNFLIAATGTGLVESQEGGVPEVGKAGKEVPVCFLKDNFFCEHWTLAFASHCVDISFK